MADVPNITSILIDREGRWCSVRTADGQALDGLAASALQEQLGDRVPAGVFVATERPELNPGEIPPGGVVIDLDAWFAEGNRRQEEQHRKVCQLMGWTDQ